MRKLTRALSMLLVCCMMFTLLPVTAEALVVDDDANTVTGDQFYPLTSVSGNGCWTFCGLIVDEAGRVHLVLGNENNNDKLDDETTLYIAYKDTPEKSYCFGHDYPDDGMTPKGPIAYQTITGESFTINIVDDENNVIGTQVINAKKEGKPIKTYYFFEIGGMEIFKNGSFKIGLETKTGGTDGGGNAWDIGSPPKDGTDVTVHFDYGITKTVAKDEDDDTIFKNTPDERITYTVTIENKSSQSDGGTGILLPVNVDYVRDYIPEGLIPESVNGVPVTDFDYGVDKDGERVLLLDSNVTLTPDPEGKSKTYTIVCRIDPNCEDGEVINHAVMGGDELVEKIASASAVIESDFFYIHHIYNDGLGDIGEGVEKRVDKININYVDGSFNVTQKYPELPCLVETADDIAPGNYDGLWPNTLYGGTFDTPDNNYTTVHEQFVNGGENGINFTPAVNEHYYVWEPSNEYLDPRNIAVWHADGAWKPADENTVYHTVDGYPIAPVDRVYYKHFGFIQDGSETDAYNLDMVYENVKMVKPDGSSNVYTPDSDWGLSGYLGCYQFNEDIFRADPERPKDCEFKYQQDGNTKFGDKKEFTPYWVTMDGVEVTSLTKRSAWDIGFGHSTAVGMNYQKFGSREDPAQAPAETVAAPSSQTLAFATMFYREVMPEVEPAPDPADVVVAYDEDKLIYSGNSGNVKGFTMTADLGEFKCDEAWFVVDGHQKKDLIVEAEVVDGKITAELNLKKVGDGEVTIIPYWSLNGEESNGSALTLIVEKKLVSAAGSIGLLTDDEYVEVVPTEEAEETEATEATEEVTEETEAAETEAVEETTEATEAVEESNKKNDKKNNNKKNDKNDKKNNKKDEVVETEPVEETVVTEPIEETVETEPTEAPVEIVYEEITTVTFVGISREFASAPETHNECVMGIELQ